MSTQVEKLLGGASRTLFGVVGQQPELAPVLAPIAELIGLVAADIDTHVADRLQEAQSIKSILRRARDLLPADRVHQIDRALALELSKPGDYTLHNIESYSADLRAALVAVHTWLDTPDGKPHSELLQDVWAVLQVEGRPLVPLRGHVF